MIIRNKISTHLFMTIHSDSYNQILFDDLGMLLNIKFKDYNINFNKAYKNIYTLIEFK
jgi:hypothetical protein